MQGESPRESLLAQFRELGNAVLLGTASFWEGVDVRGHALALVVIDKLPFAAPEDPLLKARLEGIRRRGGNPFQEFQLPQAVLALKQGFGRLIRDREDFGVVMLCDPRLATRGYGRLFIASLPPAPVVTDEDEAASVPAAPARARGNRARPCGRGMKILAVDAATEACSAALLVGATLTERYEVIGRGHAGRLLPMADELLARGWPHAARSRRRRVRPRPGRVHGPAHRGGHRAGPRCRRRQAGRAREQPCGRCRRGRPRARARRTSSSAWTRAWARSTGRPSTAAANVPRALTPEHLSDPGGVELPTGATMFGAGHGFSAYPALSARLAGDLAGIDDAALPRAGDIARIGAVDLAAGRGLPAARGLPVYLRDDVVHRR